MTAILDVFLGERKAGTINLLAGNSSIFSFDEAYAADTDRPTLSQYYLGVSGELRPDTKTTRTKLPPWFSNLLPEGRLREYLAARGGVDPIHEFKLLGLLGEDLPGAVRIIPHENEEIAQPKTRPKKKRDADAPLRFSLAGVQLKFSALLRHGGLTIPASGSGGDWIVKLPSSSYPAVPENEEAMLNLAHAAGIEVPEHRLVPLDSIKGLPDLGPFAGKNALAVQRFDRSPEARIHMEDLAQVFGIFPDDKYQGVGFARIAEIIGTVMGQAAAQDFVARLAFTILTGNGDMHLKNWSLIYPDTRTPRLAPAYDLVSTVPYIPEDRLALNFLGEKDFAAITRERFRHLAQKAALSEHETVATVERVADAVKSAWPELRHAAELPQEIAGHIERHMLKMLKR